MPSRSERAARDAVRIVAREVGLIAQTAFGPDAARRNLATAPIYKTPPAVTTKAERASLPEFVESVGLVLEPWQRDLLSRHGLGSPPEGDLVPARPTEAEYDSLPILPVELLNNAANRRAE